MIKLVYGCIQIITLRSQVSKICFLKTISDWATRTTLLALGWFNSIVGAEVIEIEMRWISCLFSMSQDWTPLEHTAAGSPRGMGHSTMRAERELWVVG